MAIEAAPCSRAILSLLPALLFSGPGAAQETPEQCPQQPADRESAEALAGTWFDEGARLVDEDRYTEALSAFACSLRMVKHPDTVFNAAQAARLSGEHRVALDLLGLYLELAPEGRMVAEVRAFIPQVTQSMKAEEDRREIEQERAWLEQTVGKKLNLKKERGILERSVAAEMESAEPQEKKSPLKTAGYVSLGVGGASLIVGAVLQGIAAKAVSDGEETDDYRDEWLDLDEKRRGYQAGALLGFIAGGVIAGTGVVLILLDRGDETSDGLTVTPALNGIRVGGRF